MTWWQYLMLVNIYLLLFYGFYALLLSRETFFQLNRIYLVTAALLSFFIPMIQADWVKNLFITQKVQYTIYSSMVLNYRFTPVQDAHFTLGQVLVLIYLAGIMFLLALRFAWQLLALKRIINKQAPSVAYSFFKKVKLGDEHEHREVIAAHENVHANQWHSADVLIMEGLMIINWFNPIVYFYRFAIKHIHEFIADRQAVKAGTDKADYAMILLTQTFNAPAHQLVNPFYNKSLLKQRILMLQKSKSQRVRMAKYFLSAPLFMLMLVLSSATVNNSKTIPIIDSKVEKVFLIAPGSQSGIAMTSYISNDQSPKTRKVVQQAQNPADANLINITLAKDTTPKKEGPVFTAVEQVPEFPGGVTAFSQFLAKNIRYPAEARDKNVQGRVIISFIVETDGTLTNFKVARSVGSGTDEEAIRVLAMSPKWSPGLQNGHKVRVTYSVPISFTLSTDEPDKKGSVEEGKNQNNTMVINQNAVPDTGKNSVNDYLKGSLYLSGASPLYVVDGVQADNLNNLKPEDIQSISILKDKNSTALYGEKGKNGVIIVTTKAYTLKHKADVIIKN